MQQEDPSQLSATELTIRLERDFYAPLAARCAAASACITLLHAGDVHQSASLFTTLSKRLIDEIGRYIYHARYSLAPYLHTLTEKDKAGHDCRSCSGSCKMQHGEQMAFLRTAHDETLETLDQLMLIMLTDGTSGGNNKAIANLRKLVTGLDQLIRQLFQMDETVLMPGILSAQNHIHAHH